MVRILSRINHKLIIPSPRHSKQKGNNALKKTCATDGGGKIRGLWSTILAPLRAWSMAWVGSSQLSCRGCRNLPVTLELGRLHSRGCALLDPHTPDSPRGKRMVWKVECPSHRHAADQGWELGQPQVVAQIYRWVLGHATSHSNFCSRTGALQESVATGTFA